MGTHKPVSKQWPLQLRPLIGNFPPIPGSRVLQTLLAEDQVVCVWSASVVFALLALLTIAAMVVLVFPQYL